MPHSTLSAHRLPHKVILPSAPMIKGILEGYGTMDALASLVFAIIVIDAVRAMGVDNRSDLLKTTAISGLMAAGCLAAVYLLIG